MSPFDRAHTTLCYLSKFRRNYASVLYRFRYIASYLSKVAIPTRRVLGAPVGGNPIGISPRSLASENKTRISRLSCGIVA